MKIKKTENRIEQLQKSDKLTSRLIIIISIIIGILLAFLVIGLAEYLY